MINRITRLWENTVVRFWKDRHVKVDKIAKGTTLIWFMMFDPNRAYCLSFEWCAPIWKLPRKYISHEEGFFIRVGWLYGAIGFGWHIRQETKEVA